MKIELFVMFLLMALVLTSCGGDDNEADSANSRTYTAPAVGTVANQTAGILSSIIAQAPACQGGTKTRINVHFNTSAVASQSTIMGPFAVGAMPPTQVSAFYIGVSAWNDIMIVSKYVGSQVYGVTLAMCPYMNILVPGRGITKFDAMAGITIAATTTGTMGTILAAKNTYLDLAAHTNLQAVKFGPTTFFPVNIK